MRNLTNVFLDSAPSRFKLAFGINKNVILKSVNDDVRRDKNGVKINKNCYLTFASVDVENNNKVTAESTFSYFNIDKPAFATKNFIHQFNQLVEIAKAVVPPTELNKGISKVQTVLSENVNLFMEIKKSPEPTAKMSKQIAELQGKVVAAYIESMAPYTGENSELVSVLVVTDPKGQFFDLPREDKGFIAKMTGRPLTMDPKYVRWFAERGKVEKDTSEDIGEEDIIDEDALIMDDDQDLEGI